MGKLLDAGGGSGALAAYVRRHLDPESITVVDVDAAALAETPAGMHTRLSRIEDLSDADGRFDTILARQVLHYVASAVDALTLLRKLLLPGGVIYVGQIVAPDQSAARWLAERASWASPTRHSVFTTDALLSLFAHAGLGLERAVIAPHWQRLKPTAQAIGATTHAGDNGAMAMHAEDDVIHVRVLWLHCLLVADETARPGGMPRQAAV
ncbi:class I SAM-dependent methyltransferase [Catellatospora sp. NEAU-YM18]|nr:class I SAM-dependent methyltransferase [Catellatospora tritici]